MCVNNAAASVSKPGTSCDVFMIAPGTPALESEYAQAHANAVVAAWTPGPGTGTGGASLCPAPQVAPPTAAPMSSEQWTAQLMACVVTTRSVAASPRVSVPTRCAGSSSSSRGSQAGADSAGSHIDRQMECAVLSTPPVSRVLSSCPPTPQTQSKVTTAQTQSDYTQSLIASCSMFFASSPQAACASSATLSPIPLPPPGSGSGSGSGVSRPRTFGRIASMNHVAVSTRRPASSHLLGQRMDNTLSGAAAQSRFAEFFPARPPPPPCPFDPPGPQAGVPIARLAPCIPTAPRVM